MTVSRCRRNRIFRPVSSFTRTVYHLFAFLTFLEQSGGKASNSHRLIGCLTTLYLMSKFQPSMLVRHAATLQPYLSTKCSVSMVGVVVVVVMTH